MTARQETDHEFKTRMAAEGRAIYVPGKTDEQIKAERAEEAERRDTALAVTIELTQGQLDQLDTALPDAIELIEDAGAVLSFISDSLFSGHIDAEDHRAWCAMRLSARALRLATDRELMILDTLDARLRATRKSKAKGGKA